MFDGMHWWDLVPLILLALLVFGPKRLPEMGSALGKTIKEFQRSMREHTDNTEEKTAPADASRATTPAPLQATPSPAMLSVPPADDSPTVTPHE